MLPFSRSDLALLSLSLSFIFSLSFSQVDKNARVGKNAVLLNKAGVEEANLEEDGLYIRSGIVTVLADATIPDGFEI